MKIYLSNSDYLRTFERLLETFDPSEPETFHIATHQKWVNVHPAVLTMVAALGSKVKPEHITIDNITATSGHYLDRMGLFDILGKESPYTITRHESAGRFIPLTKISTSDEQTKFITEMIPILHLQPEQANPIKYVVGELVRNVIEHAETQEGAFVAVQYYPKTNTVRLGISDVGIGVRNAIARSWPTNTDADALILALTPGVTGTTSKEGGNETNAGAGLFFIKSMSMVSRDYFALYSGAALYRLLKRDKRTEKFPQLHASPLKDRHVLSTDVPAFPGTVVAVDISLDQTQEFTALLSAIRAAYTNAVRERKKAKYKMPRFI